MSATKCAYLQIAVYGEPFPDVLACPAAPLNLQCTARGSFTHIIRRQKEPDHRMISGGIYK